jgi:hypothetical protein
VVENVKEVCYLLETWHADIFLNLKKNTGKEMRTRCKLWDRRCSCRSQAHALREKTGRLCSRPRGKKIHKCSTKCALTIDLAIMAKSANFWQAVCHGKSIQSRFVLYRNKRVTRNLK